MLHTYKNRYSNFQVTFLKDCFQIIGECCSSQPHNLLIGGNYALTMNENENGDYVPYMYQIPFGEKDPKKIVECEKVELYSDFGYTKLEDIAHWTDIALDMIMAQAAGCEEYNSNRKNNVEF